jgi:hypothetical protein
MASIGIGTKRIRTMPGFDEVGCQSVCCELSFSQIVQGICCFETSILDESDPKRCRELSFPCAAALMISHPPGAISTLHSDSFRFVVTKDETNCGECCGYHFERKKNECESCLLSKAGFEESLTMVCVPVNDENE